MIFYAGVVILFVVCQIMFTLMRKFQYIEYGMMIKKRLDEIKMRTRM